MATLVVQELARMKAGVQAASTAYEKGRKLLAATVLLAAALATGTGLVIGPAIGRSLARTLDVLKLARRVARAPQP
jgi:hypothetical protein